MALAVAMDHSPKAAAEPDPKSKPFSFPNGVLRKHHLRPEPASDDDCLYRECLKNHAASLGGHALDGCGEFMLAPTADPADPASLRCAACGCHRNFHRRIPDRRRRERAEESDGEGEEGEDEDEDGDDEEIDRGRSSASPPPFYSSVPHMLLALSGSLHAGPGPIPLRPVATPIAAVAAAPVGAPASEQPKKRFRTKFTPEQKERMQALSQRLGWRMQKRDEGIVEECCREIGVDKGVFKVWMHNNKHAFLGLGRRGETGGDRGGVGVGGAAGAVDVVRTEGNGGHSDDNGVVGGGGGGDGNGDGDGDGNGHTVNGSDSSS